MTTPTDQKTLRDEFAMAALTKGVQVAIAARFYGIAHVLAMKLLDTLLARKRETEE